MTPDTHTQGPWRACKDGACPCGAIWDSTGNIHLATAFDETAIGMDAFGSNIGVGRAERIANARLITAAPELFTACNEAFDFLGGADGAAEIRSKLLAAIARATTGERA